MSANHKLRTKRIELDSGSINKIKPMSIDPQNISHDDLNALFIFKRIFGDPRPNVLLMHEVSELEKVRTSIALGKFSSAISQLPSLHKSDSSQILEHLRILFFSGKCEEAYELGKLILDKFDLEPGNLALTYQIMGASATEAGSFSGAICHLEQAKELYGIATNPLGEYLTDLLIAKVYGILNDSLKAKLLYQSCYKKMITHSFGAKWFLAYLRTGLYVYGDSPEKQILTLQIAGLVAKSIGDDFHTSLSQLELLTLTKGSIENWLAISNSAADQSPRHQCLAQRITNNNSPASYQWLNSKSFTGEVPPLSDCLDYIFLKDSGLIYDIRNVRLLQCPLQSQKYKIFNFISKNNVFSKSDFFEAVWELKWSKRIHSNLLSVTFKNLREEFPHLLDSSTSEVRRTRSLLAINY